MQRQYRSEAKSRSTQTEEEAIRLVDELRALREVYHKLLQEHNVWGF